MTFGEQGNFEASTHLRWGLQSCFNQTIRRTSPYLNQSQPSSTQDVGKLRLRSVFPANVQHGEVHTDYRQVCFGVRCGVNHFRYQYLRVWCSSRNQVTQNIHALYPRIWSRSSRARCGAGNMLWLLETEVSVETLSKCGFHSYP